MDKLYPPMITGTLPSFYKSDFGTTNIVVPFSMNKTVSVSAIKGFSLRIKTTNTDILYGVVESNDWNSLEIASPKVSFEIPDKILNRLAIGSFYKVQLAYIDKDGITGYYSTIGILKYTAKPEVQIVDLISSVTNMAKTEYLGSYYNKEDPSEKVYQYRFCLYDSKDNLLESSGWCIHNTYEDTSLIESVDRYTMRYALNRNETYKIQYQVLTNNNLQLSSLKYLIMDAESIDPELRAELVAELNYENACINLNLIGEKRENGSDYAISGKFLLSRASSLDNYATWLPISQFTMTGELPQAFLFRDYTISQGATYIYSLQQHNDYGIYSNRLLTKYITAQFEDAYLFDGERQLRIRFNPKVSSFKTVVQESKKTTLGAKHPFIFRSGAVEYKEFPVTGLISYMMDNDEFFLSKSKDLYINNWENTTDITDENILVERLFKLEVLDWLNDGQPKLFKSPQEGNYIVRLMNVSLSPVDQTSRMIHNFNCTATEIADFTSENLDKYGLINAHDVVTYQMRWETILLRDKQLELQKNGKDDNERSVYNKDLLNGQSAYYVKFTDTKMGTTFRFTDSRNEIHTIMIGATGAYEIQLDEPITNLQLVVMNNTSSGQLTSNTPVYGSLTFAIKSAALNRFNTIEKVNNLDIPMHQIFGPNDNVIGDYSTLKRKVTRIYAAKFTKLDVVEVYSPLFGTQTVDGLLTGAIVDLDFNTLYDIQSINPTNNEVDHYYCRYMSQTQYYELLKELYNILYKTEFDEEYIWLDEEIEANQKEYLAWKEIAEFKSAMDKQLEQDGKLYTYPHFSTIMPKTVYSTKLIKVLDAYTVYRDPNTKQYYRLSNYQLIPEANEDVIFQNGKYYFSYKDLTPYVVYLKKYYENNILYQKYYKYDGAKLFELDNYSTRIEYGQVTLDVMDKPVVFVDEISNVPDKISIGSGVCAELSMQVKFVDYTLEQNCQNTKTLYLNAMMKYYLAVLNLKAVTDNQTLADNGIYYVWENNMFNHLEARHIESYRERTDTVYETVTDGTYYSQKVINDYYSQMKTYEKNFLDELQGYLIEYEENV